MTLDDFYDVKTAAKELGICGESVRRLIRTGALPAVKFANKWLISKNELHQYQANYKGKAGKRLSPLLIGSS